MGEQGLVLIGSGTSPFVRKVRLAAAKLGQSATFRLDAQWPPESQVATLNPLAKLPVLLTPEYGPLYDSRVIIAELQRRAGRVLRPADPIAAISDQRVEALADGIGEAVALAVQETWRPEDRRSTVWNARQQAKVERGVAALAEDHASGRLSNATNTVGAIAAICALDFLTFWFPDHAWKHGHANLAAWAGASHGDPDFAATRPIIAAGALFPKL